MGEGLRWHRQRWRWWWVVASWLLPAVMAEQRFANQPSPQTAVIGTTVVLPCRIINKVGELQWTRDDFGLGNERELYAFKRYRMIGSDEEGDFSLRISPVTLEDEAYFQCQVTGWRDIPGVRSQTAKLTVYVPPEPPQITQGPLITTTAGAGVQVDCISKGGKPAAEIQWLDGSGRVVTEGVQYTTEFMEDGHRNNARSRHSFIASRQHHNSVFTCSASNPALHHPLTTQVRMEVRYAPEVTITHSQDGYREGETATLTCSANANPNSLTYRWYRNGELVTGNNSTQLVVRYVTRESNLEDIICEVSNVVGSSKKITRLAIHYGPSFQLPPSDQYAELGENVTLRCQVDSSPDPTVVWINQQSQTVTGKGQALNLLVDRDAIGSYLCIAKVEGFPEISAIVGLFLKGPPHLSCEREQWGIQGESVMLECLITSASFSSLQITWTYQGHKLDLDSGKYDLREEVTPKGIRLVFTIQDAQLSDFGTYNCSVHNEYGFDLSEVTLSKKNTLPPLLLVGGATAGGVLVLLLAIVVFICAKKSAEQHKDGKSTCLQEKPIVLQLNDQNSTVNESELKAEFDQRTSSSMSNKETELDCWEKEAADQSSNPNFLVSTNSSYLHSDAFMALPTKMNGHLNPNSSGLSYVNYSEQPNMGENQQQQQQQQPQQHQAPPVVGFIKGSNGVARNLSGGGSVVGSPHTPQNFINSNQQSVYPPGYNSYVPGQEPAESIQSHRLSAAFNSSLTNQSYKTFSGSVPLALHVNTRTNGSAGGSTNSTIPRLGIPVDQTQYIVPPRSQVLQGALQGALATHV